MRRLLTSVIVLLLGCALGPSGAARFPLPVWVRSHNTSAVDVYVTCGDHDAEWLGVVEAKESDAFEIAPGAAQATASSLGSSRRNSPIL